MVGVFARKHRSNPRRRTLRPSLVFHALLPLLILLPALASAQAGPVAEHLVRFPDRHNQYVEVSLTLPVSGDVIEFSMPSWTPGSYQILDYAAQVERLHARGATDRDLAVRKLTKNRWRVDVQGESRITIQYSVWAGKLGVNSSWVESEFGLLNGASIFVYNESTRRWPQHVVVELPAEWRKVYTALPRSGPGSSFMARDYDELIDSPILVGNQVDYHLRVQGQSYFLVNQGETALWDGAAAARDVARIVGAVQDFWGDDPFDRPYYFLNVITAGAGGLEHDFSSVLLASVWQMRDREDYIRWMSLLTHEFFHAWNVRRLRPQALVEYDYDKEVYTRELWLAEGLSSYYDNLLLFRSGLISAGEYYLLLANDILNYETTPGRWVLSVEAASFDAWIRQYQVDANTINSAVSYYRKGALIGFVTDTIVRRASQNKASLDTIMREMYRLYGPAGTETKGFPAGAFESLVQRFAGAQARKKVETMLSSTTDPGVDEALNWYGLQLERATPGSADAATGRPQPVDFGLLWAAGAPGLVVESVIRGSTGAAAGVLPADELLAIDGTRVDTSTLDDRMLRLKAGEMTELLLARHGRIMTLAVEAQPALAEKYQISIRADITRLQKKRMADWLGVELHFIKG